MVGFTWEMSDDESTGERVLFQFQKSCVRDLIKGVIPKNLVLVARDR